MSESAKQTGLYLFGRVMGFSERPWHSDPSKLNYELGIGRDYQNEWGDASTDVTRVTVPADRVPEIKALAEKFKGKYVSVRVIVNARKGGRDGAFLSFFLPKTSDLVVQP